MSRAESSIAFLVVALAACGPPPGAVGMGDASDGTVDATDANADVIFPTDVTAEGGTVELLHFGVFGDVRPPTPDDTAGYPTMIINEVMQGMQGLGAQFAVSSGDYMFADTASAAQAQVDLLLQAESMFNGHVFHSMGNHECNGSTSGNCPNGNETPNIQQFTTRLAPGFAHVYYDWFVHTSAGDAHFIATAPNSWSTDQQTWLQGVLAMPAMYTFVLAHEPPTGSQGPGSSSIDNLVMMRSGGVTLRLYGHTHEYRHINGNEVISGNAGAPLSGFSSTYGFMIVDQLANGDIQVTEYQVGSPPMVGDTWRVHPDGTNAP